MPRQSRSSRPTTTSSRSSAPQQQTRSASTAALPQQHQGYASSTPAAAQAQAQQRQPGMLAQMAATAGSVAVGSTIGHGLSSMLFGGSGQSAAPVEQATPQQNTLQQGGASCEVQARDFTKCLDSGADVQSCSWYLEQLKACQAAARPY